MCSGITLSGENIEEWVAQRQWERNEKKGYGQAIKLMKCHDFVKMISEHKIKHVEQWIYLMPRSWFLKPLL